MRKRNVHIQFWLDKKEAEAFQKKVKRSGLSREAYLRHFVNGLEPQDAPPPDYYAMMRELHGIGNNLNQIAVKAHTLNVLDVQRYRDGVKDKISALTDERKQLYKLQRTAAVKADPEKAAEIKEQISALSKELAALRREAVLCDGINKLPETQRRRLILYYFNGLTYSQIAEMEGCKYQTVQDSIYAALNNLKKILK